MYRDIKIRKSCRICKSNNLINFADLGKMPLADLFLKNPNVVEKKFPLQVKVCSNCYLVQLVTDVDSKLLFSDNYGFYTGGSPASIFYFKNYADSILNKFPNECKNFIIEIASNDGTLLKNFIDKKINVLGIDPAKNVAREAKKNGIPTKAEFFNKNYALKLAKSKKAGVIIANNVVAHVEDPIDFMEGIKILLDKNGVFVFECQYFPYLLFNNQFDNIYHEHRSFFSLIPLKRLLNTAGLEAFDIEEQDTQGGSIRVFVTHKGQRKVSSSLKMFLRNEIEIGINNINTYSGFQARINYVKIKLNRILANLKNENKIIAGYGASAKSSTLLNYCEIGTKYLDYILDKTPYKYDLYTPGTHIPILSEEEEKKKPDYYLLLVWNYAEKIMQKEKKFVKNSGRFIIPIPTPYVR